MIRAKDALGLPTWSMDDQRGAAADLPSRWLRSWWICFRLNVADYHIIEMRRLSGVITVVIPVAIPGDSLPELINKRDRSVIQIIERMQPAMIVNPNHQYFSVFSSRHVPRRLGSVLIECCHKAKNPGRSGSCERIVIATTFNPGDTRNIPLS
jgi:hypothetical protein